MKKPSKRSHAWRPRSTDDASRLSHSKREFLRFVGAHELAPLPWVTTWEANYWPLTKRTTSASAGDGGLWFTVGPMTKSAKGEPLAEPFSSFLKALICEYDGRRAGGFSTSNLQGLIAAGRLLCATLVGRKASPWEVRRSDFDEAFKKWKSKGSSSANIGSKLKYIATVVSTQGIAAVPFNWRPPINWSAPPLVGLAADEARNRKMPARGVINALAQFSAQAADDGKPSPLEVRDLLCQRAVDLMICGPFRITEVLTLPCDTLIEEPVLEIDGRPRLDGDGRPQVAVGLRYRPAKFGYRKYQIKWVPSELANVARRAVADIKQITAPFRSIAKYQANNPGKTICSLNGKLLEGGEILAPEEVARALNIGLTTRHTTWARAGRQFIHQNKIPFWRENGTYMFVRSADLMEVLYERSRHGNILAKKGDLNIEDALFVISIYFMKRHYESGFSGTATMMTDEQIRVYLRGSWCEKSIFERAEKIDAEGKPLRMSSSQLRHLLTTLADEGGLSELDQMRWAGRVDPTHNSSYHHTPARELARRVRHRMMNGEMIGPVASKLAEIADPVRREEFVFSSARTAHVTDLGVCVHDWEASPCPRYGGCEDCWDLRVIKGDTSSQENAYRLRNEVEHLKSIAEQEIAEGSVGADRWLRWQNRMLERLNAIITVHEDNSIPEDAMVQLSGGSRNSVAS